MVNFWGRFSAMLKLSSFVYLNMIFPIKHFHFEHFVSVLFSRMSQLIFVISIKDNAWYLEIVHKQKSFRSEMQKYRKIFQRKCRFVFVCLWAISESPCIYIQQYFKISIHYWLVSLFVCATNNFLNRNVSRWECEDISQ